MLLYIIVEYIAVASAAKTMSAVYVCLGSENDGEAVYVMPWYRHDGNWPLFIVDKCIYVDNSLYSKGSTWNVGCDYVCTCEDPTTNKYKCNARSVLRNPHQHLRKSPF